MWSYKWFIVKERERPFNYGCGHVSDLLSKNENDLLIIDVAISVIYCQRKRMTF